MSRARTPVDGLRQKLRVAVKGIGIKDFETDLRRGCGVVFLYVFVKESVDDLTKENLFKTFLGYNVVWEIKYDLSLQNSE